MNWLAWRQHRKQFMIAGIFLILFAAIIIPTGLNFWHTYQHALSTCGNTNTCSQLGDELFQSNADQSLFNYMGLGVLIAPILIGLFWGAPFLAREYADGTNKLVWTQSVSRRKWLTIKLIWVLGGAVVLSGAFAALYTWWLRPENALLLNRFGPAKFESQGIVPIAYTVFAVALGIMFGAWFKRTMLALGVTFFLSIALILIVVPNFVRPYYMTPLVHNAALLNNTGQVEGDPLSPQAPPNSGASLLVSGNLISKSGRPISWSNPPQSCVVAHPDEGGGVGPVGQHAAVIAKGGAVRDAIVSRNAGPAVDINCLGKLGYHWSTKYQPAYRYWDFQWIETALYLALAVIPIGATYWFVLKRDA